MGILTTFFVCWALLYCNATSEILSQKRSKFLKAFLPLLIISFHHITLSGNWPWYIERTLGTIGMPINMLFFFMSGYGLEYKRVTQGGGFSKRLKKLLIPLVLPTLIYVVTLVLMSDDYIGVLDLNLHKNWSLLPFTWFVVVLAFMYIGFHACSRFSNNTKIFYVSLFIYIFLLNLLIRYSNAPMWMTSYNWGFYVGIFFKDSECELLKVLKGHKTRITVVALSLIFMLGYTYFHHKYGEWFYNFIFIVLYIQFVMFSFCKIIESKTIEFLSKISYEVYLCQGIGFLILPYKDFNNILSLIAVVIISIVLAVICNKTQDVIIRKYDIL